MNLTALIVDDDRDACSIFKVCLTQAGYAVIEAHNGQEALAALKKRSFDLITLDLTMPDVDGLTVLKSMRKDPLHMESAVVIITAATHLTANPASEWADFVMHKPLNLEHFIEFVKRLSAAR